MPVMHHPVLKREVLAQDAGQVRVMKKSGWVDGPLPKKRPAIRPVKPSREEGDRSDG